MLNQSTGCLHLWHNQNSGHCDVDKHKWLHGWVGNAYVIHQFMLKWVGFMSNKLSNKIHNWIFCVRLFYATVGVCALKLYQIQVSIRAAYGMNSVLFERNEMLHIFPVFMVHWSCQPNRRPTDKTHFIYLCAPIFGERSDACKEAWAKKPWIKNKIEGIKSANTFICLLLLAKL